MNIHSTLLFLKDLVGTESDANLVTSLVAALKQDGYYLQSLAPHYLRRLQEEEHTAEPGSSDYTVSVVLVTVCVICAGCASGLTQGLLSLDYMEMTIKARSGTPTEQKYAKKVLPVISQHHILLVTLMLWNACANEALPIFLNQLVPEYVAIIVSVTLVLFVGEIIPASILTGPNQLMIAANMLPLLYCVIVVFFPISYPIAKVLDYVIGHDSGVTVYNKKEITTMMALQHEEGMRQSEKAHGVGGAVLDLVNQEEVAIIGGALKFREMCVSEVMTPINDVYMISATEKLNAKTLFEIFKSGYSRIPVFDRDVNDVIGLILAKDLIFVDVEDETPVRNFVELFGRQPAVVWHDDKLGETLSLFRSQRAHMALVRDVKQRNGDDPIYVITGVITLEDIIEEILGAEIEDETEHMEDSHFVKSPQFRDMDFARLKLLNNAKVQSAEDQLTSDEVRAIVSHLSSNVPAVRNLFEGNTTGLTELIRHSSVMTMKRQTSTSTEAAAGSALRAQEDLIYRRGKVATMCTLILSGSISVLAGKDEFLSQVGPWSLLGVDALLLPEGSYTPDFSAFVESESVRFVSISMSAGQSKLQHQQHQQQHVVDLLHHHTGGSGSSSSAGVFSGSTSAAALTHGSVAAAEFGAGEVRNRSASRGGSFYAGGGAHSLAERKQSMHRRRSHKDLPTGGAAATASGSGGASSEATAAVGASAAAAEEGTRITDSDVSASVSGSVSPVTSPFVGGVGGAGGDQQNKRRVLFEEIK